MIKGFKFLDGGLEHQVYFRPRTGRIIKITKPPHFGHTWYLKDYVQNLIRCNLVFGDDFRLEGVISSVDGLSIVISQPFMVGRKPTEAQIEDWFHLHGCVKSGTFKWRYPDGMLVADAHSGNFVRTRDGILFPIDLHIEKMGEPPSLP